MATASFCALVLWAVLWYMVVLLSLLLLCTVSQLSAGKLPFNFIFPTQERGICQMDHTRRACVWACVYVCVSLINVLVTKKLLRCLV